MLFRRFTTAISTVCAVGFLTIFPALAQRSGALPAEESTQLTIEWDGRQLAIRGAVSTLANDLILRQIAAISFPNSARITHTRTSASVPPGWSLVTELTLRALAKTRSATAQITPNHVQIHGSTDELKAWDDASQSLLGNLLGGMQSTISVSGVARTQTLHEYCQSLFERVGASQSIDFAHSSNLLSTSAFPLLDELVQIAADCPDSTMRVTGHTDRSGEEAFNLALSAARANAVVDYMVSRGIARERIRAKGEGSSSPLSDEVSSRARRKNRRIEITLDQ